LRQLALNGAEVLIRVSAYIILGSNRTDGLVDVNNRARAIENLAYVAAANQARV
jgi:predicted amidohydrolase